MFKSICVIKNITLANGINIYEAKTDIKPSIIIIPIIDDINKFEIINVNDIVLYWYKIIGNITKFALTVMRIISSIFSFIFWISFWNLFSFAFSFLLFLHFFKIGYINTIPRVPPYESCKPISKIEYGFMIKIIKIDMLMLANTFALLWSRLAKIAYTLIKHALSTDAVFPVRIMKNSKITIVIIFDIFLLNFILLIRKVIPNITYDTCIPEIAKICDKLLFLKSSCISFGKLLLSPISIPESSPDVAADRFCSIFPFIEFLTLFASNSIIFVLFLFTTFTSFLSTVTIPYIFLVFKYCL